METHLPNTAENKNTLGATAVKVGRWMGKWENRYSWEEKSEEGKTAPWTESRSGGKQKTDSVKGATRRLWAPAKGMIATVQHTELLGVEVVATEGCFAK